MMCMRLRRVRVGSVYASMWFAIRANMNKYRSVTQSIVKVDNSVFHCPLWEQYHAYHICTISGGFANPLCDILTVIGYGGGGKGGYILCARQKILDYKSIKSKAIPACSHPRSTLHKFNNVFDCVVIFTRPNFGETNILASSPQ